MELTRTFSGEQYARALESWSWLSFEGLAPRFTSLFGDVFFEARDGGWWWLSHLEGDLTRPWPDRAALDNDLATEDGRDHYLYGVFAAAARDRGLVLKPSQVYAWVPHPILSQDFNTELIQAFDFVVVMHLTGQLHEQVRHQG